MKCEDCRWWLEIPESGYGKCKRFPPRWVTPNDCAYPLTGPADYCGEHEEAPQDPAAAGS